MSSASMTPKVVHPGGLWLDDLTEGFEFRSGHREVTAEEIVDFASKFDPQSYHLDAEDAAGTFFDGLVASGWHTAALTMRLLTEAFPLATGLIGAHGEMTWPTATLPGDRLRVEGRVESIETSASRPGRASMRVSFRSVNQEDKICYTAVMRMLAWRRPEGERWEAGDQGPLSSR
ncbi:MaoC/PaaZ C-terminal domain-containing protein [Gordonia aurantiaca]|uniref:MaoC/PaaZ C-terminal domain-containing protein n=1 Tax=Gordonia sp. B21 TaxID=3151852 RepID=UPI003263EAA2